MEYTKIGFTSGQKLKADHMNHIENGIAALAQKIGQGAGGASVQPDWNENNPESPAYVKNRTHYESVPAFNIQWDGIIGDRFALDMSALGFDEGLYYVKVSDFAPTAEEIVGATFSTNDSDGETISSDYIDADSYPGALCVTEYIIIAYDQNTLNSALGLPDGYITNGVYFYLYQGNGVYTKQLTAPVEIHKLDEKYLPDTCATKEYVDSIILGAIGGSY